MSLPPLSSDPRLAALAAEPCSAEQLEERLDEILDPVLSSRRTATALAQAIAPLARDEQDFVLHWASVVARSNHEMAYQFVAAAPRALATLGLEAAEEWLIRAMDTYDREGLYRGSTMLKDIDAFAALTRAATTAATYDEVAEVLQLFVCGLAGRRLKFASAVPPYTDTETIHLPPRIALLPTKSENFAIYKGLATLLWAQTRFGTFNVDLRAICNAYPDPERALALVNSLETVRLEAQIARLLPGLGRELQALRASEPPPDPRTERLRMHGQTVEDTIALLGQVYGDMAPLNYRYMPRLDPDAAMTARTARIAREKAQLGSALADLADIAGNPENAETDMPRFSLEAPDAIHGQQLPTLFLDGQPFALPENLAQLMDSILQDLGEIPDDYLVAAGDGGYRETASAENVRDVWKGAHHEHAAFFYNEWDCRRRHYRKDWCVLRELDVHPGNSGFIDTTLAKYAPQVAQLKRTFELLRGEDRLLKRQFDGDDIDFDALVSAYADMQHGMELPERLLTRRQKTERNLAVMFMVDMSGSTKGWINDAEREALVMLCEALEVLGDRYAIYGFSGITRKRCEIFRIKRFDEPYDAMVQGRIAGISPQDYTRMGVAIRHLTTLLDTVEARTKLLITLSDGKPDDYSDQYRGEYGIEDTRQALVEAHRSGIKPFCITIDREARDYLPHMYGPVNWTLVDDVARLPLKVAEIYRRLTS